MGLNWRKPLELNLFPVNLVKDEAAVVEEGRQKTRVYATLFIALFILLMAIFSVPAVTTVRTPISQLSDYTAIASKSGLVCPCTAPPSKLGPIAALKRTSAAWNQSFTRNFCSALSYMQNHKELWPPWLVQSSSNAPACAPPPDARPICPKNAYTWQVYVHTKLFFLCDTFAIAEKQSLLSFRNQNAPTTTLLSPSDLAEFARTALADQLWQLKQAWGSALFTYAYDADRPFVYLLGSESDSNWPPDLGFDTLSRDAATNTPDLNIPWYALAKRLNLAFNNPQSTSIPASLNGAFPSYFFFVLLGGVENYFEVGATADDGAVGGAYGPLTFVSPIGGLVYPDLTRVRGDILDIDYGAYFKACRPRECVYIEDTTATISAQAWLSHILNTAGSQHTNALLVAPYLWFALMWLAGHCGPRRAAAQAPSKWEEAELRRGVSETPNPLK